MWRREGEIDNHETRGLSATAVLQEAGRRPRLALWLADERLGAFTVSIGKPAPGAPERAPPMLRLRLLNREEQLSQAGTAGSKVSCAMLSPRPKGSVFGGACLSSSGICLLS